ncbi:hypothetical protein [Anaerococcus hydrogenalis]|nr:hypothetical protein [Anaerococcus hydrogenalis]
MDKDLLEKIIGQVSDDIEKEKNQENLIRTLALLNLLEQQMEIQ